MCRQHPSLHLKVFLKKRVRSGIVGVSSRPPTTFDVCYGRVPKLLLLDSHLLRLIGTLYLMKVPKSRRSIDSFVCCHLYPQIDVIIITKNHWWPRLPHIVGSPTLEVYYQHTIIIIYKLINNKTYEAHTTPQHTDIAWLLCSWISFNLIFPGLQKIGIPSCTPSNSYHTLYVHRTNVFPENN